MLLRHSSVLFSLSYILQSKYNILLEDLISVPFIIFEASIYLYLSTLHEMIDNLTHNVSLVLDHSPTHPQPSICGIYNQCWLKQIKLQTFNLFTKEWKLVKFYVYLVPPTKEFGTGVAKHIFSKFLSPFRRPQSMALKTVL